MITVLRQLLISQDPRGDRKFPVTAEGMKEERSIAIFRERWQTHSENALLTPLEIQATDIVIARQRIRHEVAVGYSPGRVLLPWINDQTVTQFVGHVSERVVATTFSQIDRDVGNEGVLRCE